jgi:RNA polymerase sigma factor (TIGR02999 family)
LNILGCATARIEVFVGTTANDVTRILEALGRADASAAEELLPLVYDELRRLAAEKVSKEQPGQTLNATALVHEAYVRLVDVEYPQHWNSRGHFFAAAAEAMRRLLVEQARRKAARRRSGLENRVDLNQLPAADETRGDELLAIHEALAKLERHDERAARLVKLRYFAGLTHQAAAEAMGLGRGAADQLWAMARVWLYEQIYGK